MLSASLHGDGVASVLYGNCYGVGVVKLYLNGTVISSATADSDEQVSFSFEDGDTLEIKEEDAAMMVIKSFSVINVTI